MRGNRLRAAGIVLALCQMLSALSARSEESQPGKDVTWGGYVDTYYAYDFTNPPNHDRSFTTQPARQNEFNVNLAYLEAKLNLDRVRGRIALQVGTSVQSNYASEPSLGSVSGPDLARHIQEAYAGYRLAQGLWVDAGIYFSHVGMESFISRDNWTYTRSLVADYSPYYQTGAKISYQLSEKWGFQLHLLNGWQTISENNGAKTVGTQVSFTPNSSWSVTYSTLFGKEAEFRQFHDLVVKYAITDGWQAALQADLGFQDRSSGSASHWYGLAVLQRYELTKTFGLGLRVERYADPDQVIVTTGTSSGFQVWGASINADAKLDPRVLWRTELRGFWSEDGIYPTSSSVSTSDSVVVTSLSISI